MKSSHKKSKKNIGDFKTLAILEPDKRDSATHSVIPSDRNVKEAKDWVDHNKK